MTPEPHLADGTPLRVVAGPKYWAGRAQMRRMGAATQHGAVAETIPHTPAKLA